MADLNDYLQPKNSPITQQGTAFTGVEQFQTSTDMGIVTTPFLQNGAVTDAKVGSLSANVITTGTLNSQISYLGTVSFNQSTGGTIVLGGTANGNGLMLVKDAGGTTRVQVDNTGIIVNDGSITLNNSGSVTMLDSFGLVGTTNFPFSSVSGSGFGTITSTSYTDVTGLSLSVVLNRTQQIFVSWIARGASRGDLGDTAVKNPVFQADINGTATGNEGNTPPSFTQDDFGSPSTIVTYFTTTSSQFVTTLTAGTHTLKLRIKQSGSNANGVVVDRSGCVLTYFRMGA